MPPKAPVPRGRGRGTGRGGQGRGGAAQAAEPTLAEGTAGGEQVEPSRRTQFPTEDPARPLEFSGLPLEPSETPTSTAQGQISAPSKEDITMSDAPRETTANGNANVQAASVTSTSGAPAPSPAPATTAGSVRGGKRGGLAALPRFASRRTKAQRDADKAEADARKAAEPKAKPPPVPRKFEHRRGDGRPGRARGGGYMGDRFQQQLPPGASGPFSAGTVSHDFKKGSIGIPSSRGFGGGSGPSAQSGGGSGSGGGGWGGSGSSGVRIKTEDGTSSGGIISRDIGRTNLLWSDDENSGDDQDPGEFFDIDKMNQEDSKDGIDLDGPKPAREMLPIRPKRQERQPRGQVMSVVKSSKLDRKRAMRALDPKGKAQADDDPAYAGVYSSEEYSSDDAGESEVKQEPGTDGPATQAPKDKKPRSRRHAGPELQTSEERAEYARHIEGLEAILNELGPDTLGDVAMSGAEAPADHRADKVYLFQFPPVLPDLLTAVERVKPEPGVSEADAPEVADAAKRVEADTSTAAAVKPDPDAVVEPLETKPVRPGAQLSSGLVGKLRVHASGKVTIDWGGTSLQVGFGTKMEFLQEVVVSRRFPEGTTGVAAGEGEKGATEEKSDVKQPEGMVGGEALSMGQVRGRFVVTPDWDEIV